jgi:hypothetical protein
LKKRRKRKEEVTVREPDEPGMWRELNQARQVDAFPLFGLIAGTSVLISRAQVRHDTQLGCGFLFV